MKKAIIALLIIISSQTSFAAAKKASCEKTQDIAIANLVLGTDKVWEILRRVKNKDSAEKASPQLEHCVAYMKTLKPQVEKENWEPKTKEDNELAFGIFMRMNQAMKGIEKEKIRLKQRDMEAYKIVSIAME